MSFSTVIQQAVYTALNGNIAAGVYDDVPFMAEGQPKADFPFVYIGQSMALPWDTDDTLGQRVRIIIHVWSRASGMKETKELLGAIYDILNRSTLTISGYNVIDCLHRKSDTMLDDDARTRHGIIEFTMTIQRTS